MCRRLLLLLALATSVLAQEPPPSTKVIGGEEAPRGDYPFLVAIVNAPSSGSNFQDQFCGGSLIAPRWILTAAHCMDGYQPSGIEVLVGAHDLGTGEGERIPVEEIIIHPNYDDFSFSHDFALLRLAYAADAEIIDWLPPGRPESEAQDTPGTVALIAGWGTLDVEGSAYPNRLQQTRLTLDANANWDRPGGGYEGELDASMILARAADGQSDSCSGDSGGPLFIQEANGTWLLLGVVSWGRQCLDPILPGAYSRVKHAADWILQSIDPALYSHVTRFPLARWSSDTDDDGWPDLTEYAAGTLPDDSRSVPEVTLAPGNDGTWTASGSLRAHLNASWWRLETTRDWQTWEEAPPTVSGGNWQRTLPDHAATFLRVRAQLGDREGLARQTNALPR